MKYQNYKTKVIIDVASRIRGGDWVPADENNVQDKVKKTTVNPKPVPDTTSNDDDSEGITKAQIMQELDAFGIKYDSNAKKEILYDLMMKGKK